MKYEALHFTMVQDKIYPDKQLVGTFLISDHLLATRLAEVRPLTLDHLIYALARNHIRIAYWWIIRCLFRIGFIDLPRGEMFSRHYLRFRFWRPRKYAV